MPEREYIEKTQRPLASTYRKDYMPAMSSKQIFIDRPKTSFDGVATTSYRYSHGNGAPNKATINAMNNEALKLSLLNRKDRAMSAVSKGRESVASCLTWVSAKPSPSQPDPVSNNSAVRPVVPPCTTTSEYVPHPPSAPKPQVAWAPPPPPAVSAPPQEVAPVVHQPAPPAPVATAE